MKEETEKLSERQIESRTSMNRYRIKSVIDFANSLINDPSKIDRENKNECKYCFYDSRIGGCAMTDQDCAICGVTQEYGSTDTDMLCLECARENKLCKHCAGKLEQIDNDFR